MRKVSVLVGAEIGAAMGWDKAPCLTTNSNTAGVGTKKTSRWFLEYEELEGR